MLRTVADRFPRAPSSAIELLDAAAAITARTERCAVDAALLTALARLWQPDRARLYRLVDGDAPACEPCAEWSDDGARAFDGACRAAPLPLGCVPGGGRAVAQGAPVVTPAPHGRAVLTFPIRDRHRQPARLLELSGRAGLAEQAAAVQRLLALYENHLNLIDDSERDTLTGLRNRRTFDRLLIDLVAAAAGEPGFRRRPRVAASSWLAVLDIDRFKSINDRYGHLFGDEVLILVANLMRSSFRATDHLFRFGGEEFVVVLPGIDEPGAGAALDRFRRHLAAQRFPQVGQVTVSAGYTRVAPGALPSEVLNRADAALYYAKGRGRNRCCGYETLVATGAIAPLPHATSQGFELF
jgi:diguanylate cyclase (GGDEF)-like protein